MRIEFLRSRILLGLIKKVFEIKQRKVLEDTSPLEDKKVSQGRCHPNLVEVRYYPWVFSQGHHYTRGLHDSYTMSQRTSPQAVLLGDVPSHASIPKCSKF